MYIHVEFPAGINSLDLYEMVKRYKLNVTDLKDVTYLYGESSYRNLPAILDICTKFSYKSMTIKNPTS